MASKVNKNEKDALERVDLLFKGLSEKSKEKVVWILEGMSAVENLRKNDECRADHN